MPRPGIALTMTKRQRHSGQCYPYRGSILAAVALPPPGICVTALRIREKDQAAAKAAVADAWA
jgi:hypothetical protein